MTIECFGARPLRLPIVAITAAALVAAAGCASMNKKEKGAVIGARRRSRVDSEPDRF